jgi:hypothetical protein
VYTKVDDPGVALAGWGVAGGQEIVTDPLPNRSPDSERTAVPIGATQLEPPPPPLPGPGVAVEQPPPPPPP